MRLVVDANILFAALIRDGAVAELLFEKNLELYVPGVFFSELRRNEALIREKSTREDFDAAMRQLLERVHQQPPRVLHPHWASARRSSPDPKDTAYFALALALRCPFWTAERGLERQTAVRVVRTEGLLRRFKKA